MARDGDMFPLYPRGDNSRVGPDSAK